MLVEVFIGVLGAIIGSFLNVVILRQESGEALTGRSHCPHCGHTLHWYELIPVLSYLFQRGRCRSCAAPLSTQYPLVELTTACLFVLVYRHVVGATPYTLHPTTLLLHWALWSTLVVIFVYDLKTKLIPDRFSATFACLALATTAVSLIDSPVSTTYNLQPTTWTTLLEHVIAGLLLFLPFYLLWHFSAGRWMGLGDGKLAVGIGWLLGLAGGGAAIMLAFWIGAATMLVILALQRFVLYISSRRPYNLQPTTYNLKSEVPFGPFLIIGTFLAYEYGITFWTLMLW